MIDRVKTPNGPDRIGASRKVYPSKRYIRAELGQNDRADDSGSEREHRHATQP